MLDGTGDPASNIQLGRDGLAGLADLVRVRDPAGVDSGTGSADRGAQRISQRLDVGLKAFRTTDAAAAGNDDVGAFQIDDLFGGVTDLAQQLCPDLLFGNMEVFADDISFFAL